MQQVFTQNNLVALSTQMKEIAKQTQSARNIYLIGTQQDFLTAQEAALKLKEITYIPCEAYPAGELKHGTISLIQEGTLVVAFLTDPSVCEKTLNAVHEVKSRGAKVLGISTMPLEKLQNQLDVVVSLQTPSVSLVPLVAILPIQLLVYHMSVEMGYNPDKPRNLAKSVTVE